MSSQLTAPSSSPFKEPEPDPFRYGWRYVKRTKKDGTVQLDQVPLTLEDVLHPQENDVIPERPIQEIERGYLAAVFRTRLSRLRGGLVLSDCIVDWGVPGVRNHSPDVSVFEGLSNQPNLRIGTFRLRRFGGHCLLAIEIVSPDTRVNDVDRKLEEYFPARVPLYIIIDQERETGPRTLLAYRRGRRGFIPVAKDAEDRVLLKPLGLLLGMRDDRVVCYDAETGSEVGDYTQITEALEAETAARQAAERQATLEAEARIAAERQAEAYAAHIRELEAQIQRKQNGKAR